MKRLQHSSSRGYVTLRSTFLVGALLSPVVLQTNTCTPAGNAKLAVLELRVESSVGEDRIQAFNPNVVQYDTRFSAAEGRAVLHVEAQDRTAAIEVRHDDRLVPLAWGAYAVLDMPLGFSELRVKVSVDTGGSAPYSWNYIVKIERGDTIHVTGLYGEVQVTTDVRGVPHVVAETLRDALFMEGYLQARDRLWNMDHTRRVSDGRRGELTGFNNNDWRWRMFDLRGASERALALLSAEEISLLEAHADGINAWIDTNPLPAIYAQKGITDIPVWDVVDSILIYKWRGSYSAFESDWDVRDSDLLAQYQSTLGAPSGRALYFEDLSRAAQLVPAAIVPDALGVSTKAVGHPARRAARIPDGLDETSRAVVRSYAERLRADPDAYRRLPRDRGAGSNNFGVAAYSASSGAPLVAGDGHNVILAPSTDYEIHLTVTDDPVYGRISATGYTLGGLPGLEIGQTEHIAWNLTSAYPDVCDVFADRLVRDEPGCPADLCIDSEGGLHPVEQRYEQYWVNNLGGGLTETTHSIQALHPWSVHVLTVPFRSFGPILEVADPSVVFDPVNGAKETTVLTLQCVAFHGSRDFRGFMDMLTAQSVEDFGAAARHVTQIPNNYIVADTAGQLAFFQSGEVPLRADLESGKVFGELPYLVRDGSGPANWIPDPARSEGQAIPFRIVPYAEMPQVVNPPTGFIVTANNSPLGHERDNDLTNDFRASNPSAIYYLAHPFVAGQRAGRLTQLIGDQLASAQLVSMEDMERWQTNTQNMTAELFVPQVLAAWENAQAIDAPPELFAFTADSALAEAIGRLAAWDFSHPTGIPEGYDASDADGVRGPVSAEEAAHSVAATLYANWRAELLRLTVESALSEAGLTHEWKVGWLAGLWHLLQQEPFTGIGASGLDFFPGPEGLTPEARRDFVLLQALQEALSALASPLYEDAFGGSTNQDDYRWGVLNRLIVRDGWTNTVVIPSAGGFDHLSLVLRGISRDGGFTVNRCTGDGGLMAQGSHAFVCTVAARYRVVASVGDPAAGSDGVLGWASLAGGGNSADVEGPYFAAQFATYLTGDHHRIVMNEAEVAAVADTVEVFGP